MWLILAGLYAIMITATFSETPDVTLVYVIRNILGSVGFFYFTFYFLIPEVLGRGYIFLSLVCLFLLFFYWSVLNYLCTTYVYYNLTLHNLTLKRDVATVMNGGWGNVFSVVHMLRIFIPVIMTIAPAMSLKLVLDIIRFSTRTLRLERDNLNLELSFLRSQLNPHFLFNTLNNIYALSIRNDALASDLIMHLSEMMRYTLYDSNTEKVDLNKEADFLKNYIELESVRYGKSASIRFICDTEKISNQQIAPLLMFPFVENAFKYSHNTNPGNCWIHASMEVNGSLLSFEITNSKGELPEQKQVIGGIGLSNTRKRLALLYPDRHMLHIENNTDYYKVVLTLTLN
ncbi:sensor histidine kinase [Chitinophaga nivalis]|uniref:Histidine kinase n=1 Tax=Chitinophaga nivalis TaxID=2991709 RepID=A0ABT3IU18_9BACT|nr:histidine kinase [Chitinophaga nivalis]MCW3462840.1 histidine kinase [Chitinophaga nivalis]MCW3487470.1 histidine kinase [Chitinophaga nivalis]